MMLQGPWRSVKSVVYTVYRRGGAGLSNLVMSVELGVVLASLTDRVLILKDNNDAGSRISSARRPRAQHAEDETDEAAEQADQRAGDDGCAHVRFPGDDGRPSSVGAEQVDAEEQQRHSDRREQCRRGEATRKEAPGEGSDH